MNSLENNADLFNRMVEELVISSDLDDDVVEGLTLCARLSAPFDKWR